MKIVTVHLRNKMNLSTQRLKKTFYRNQEHPYSIFEKIIRDYLQENCVMLDIGCGREAPVLQKFGGDCKTLIGMDMSEIKKTRDDGRINFIVGDLVNIGLQSNSVDVVIARSVLEHIETPEKVYQEIYRVLRHGGHFIFLTPNLYDYASICAKVIPNRFHSHIVKLTEGRNEHDTFPTYYKSNTPRAIGRMATSVGFRVNQILLLGQYPSYFMFNPLLFMVGTVYDKLICRFDSLRLLRGWILGILYKK